jgi:hypothetical protein
MPRAFPQADCDLLKEAMKFNNSTDTNKESEKNIGTNVLLSIKQLRGERLLWHISMVFDGLISPMYHKECWLRLC